MLSKKEQALKAIDEISIIQCPICKQPMKRINDSLICSNNHNYQINRKGVVNFALKNEYSLYNTELFQARRHIINKYYSNFIKELKQILKALALDTNVVIDAGTGEGTYLNQLSHHFKHSLGIDLASDGINLATDYRDSIWFIADLANLPLQSNSVDLLLNILSPANYSEFKRVIKKDGYIIKVIPSKNFLIELREQQHNNQEVMDHLKQELDIIKQHHYFETIAIDDTDKEAILKMTPLTEHHQLEEFKSITLDFEIIVAKIKEEY